MVLIIYLWLFLLLSTAILFGIIGSSNIVLVIMCIFFISIAGLKILYKHQEKLDILDKVGLIGYFINMFFERIVNGIKSHEIALRNSLKCEGILKILFIFFVFVGLDVLPVIVSGALISQVIEKVEDKYEDRIKQNILNLKDKIIKKEITQKSNIS